MRSTAGRGSRSRQSQGGVSVQATRTTAIARALTGREGFEPRHATLLGITAAGTTIDRAVLTFFPAPHSYTGEDVLEISAHGSPVVIRGIVAAAIALGIAIATV